MTSELCFTCNVPTAKNIPFFFLLSEYCDNFCPCLISLSFTFNVCSKRAVWVLFHSLTPKDDKIYKNFKE